MALPKRKQSKARGRKRRTHWKTKTVTISTCPQCNQQKMPHRACPNCGYYKGRPVTTPTT
ncbi:MAG: 50S ribosomal protein L32 [Candidatus Neomarinimicrobiota bacterium]|nr:50S ribosomal protein L32 [Candidatus Neomarinimicrobiota bacterium]